jgi:hypothetical protein
MMTKHATVLLASLRQQSSCCHTFHSTPTQLLVYLSAGVRVPAGTLPWSLQASLRVLEQTCTLCTGLTSRLEGEPACDDVYDAAGSVQETSQVAICKAQQLVAGAVLHAC